MFVFIFGVSLGMNYLNEFCLVVGGGCYSRDYLLFIIFVINGLFGSVFRGWGW